MEEGTLSISFYEANTTLIPKLDRDSTKTRKLNLVGQGGVRILLKAVR